VQNKHHRFAAAANRNAQCVLLDAAHQNGIRAAIVPHHVVMVGVVRNGNTGDAVSVRRKKMLVENINHFLYVKLYQLFIE